MACGLVNLGTGMGWRLWWIVYVYTSVFRGFPFLSFLCFPRSNHVLMYCILRTSLWDVMGVFVKDSKSWEFLRVYPEIMKMRSWPQEVEESRRVSTKYIKSEHIHTRISESFWEHDRSIECLIMFTSLCSGREVNKKLKKQCGHCIRYVYDVVDLDILEGLAFCKC